MSSRRKQKLMRQGIGADGRETMTFDPTRTAPRPTPPLPVTEIPVHDTVRERYYKDMIMYRCEDRYIRTFYLGQCSAIVTREFGKLHASVAHPHRDPTWAEIRAARDRFFPAQAWVVQVLPPEDHYVNAHAHCFHLWEVDRSAIDPHPDAIDVASG
jgi:hypothetical protein